MSFLLLANYGAIVNGVALTFIALFMVYGYVKGFAKSFVSVFGTILSLLFAVVLCTACANFLQEQYNLVGKISEKLATPMFNLFGEETMSLTLSEITDGSFKGVGVSKLIVSVVLSFAEKALSHRRQRY